MARNVGELARNLAGCSGDAQRFAAACRLVAAQIDLLDIRETRRPLLALAIEDPSAIHCLDTLDRHERYARTRRRHAVRAFIAATAVAESSDTTTDVLYSLPNEANAKNGAKTMAQDERRGG